MRSGVIAQKVGMTRIFHRCGRNVPVTVLKLDAVKSSRTGRRSRTATRRAARHRPAKVKNVSKGARTLRGGKVEPKMKLANFASTKPACCRSAGITRIISWSVSSST